MLALGRNVVRLRSSQAVPLVFARQASSAAKPTIPKARIASLTSQFLHNGKMTRRGVWALGGVGAVSFGALLLGSDGDEDEAEDPRDMRALSEMPLRKLVTGWM